MDDLIARTKKYATSAGRTGLGHYMAVSRYKKYNQLLSITSIVLSAIVGTSIFTEWVQKYPVQLGLASIVAASLSAVKGASKLAEQAEEHKIAGAEYGRIRRRVDMLRLTIEAGDITREEALENLSKIGESLSELAKKSRVLPDSIYYPAIRKFDKDHSEYFDKRPSHAGGVVRRKVDSLSRYLVISAKNKQDQWVLPKGHIKSGESSEQAALREVLEETGVKAAIRDPIATVEFQSPKEKVHVQFFLMEAVNVMDTVNESLSLEGRKLKWCNYNEALQLLSFKEARRVLGLAYLLSQNTDKLG